MFSAAALADIHLPGCYCVFPLGKNLGINVAEEQSPTATSTGRQRRGHRAGMYSGGSMSPVPENPTGARARHRTTPATTVLECFIKARNTVSSRSKTCTSPIAKGPIKSPSLALASYFLDLDDRVGGNRLNSTALGAFRTFGKTNSCRRKINLPSRIRTTLPTLGRLLQRTSNMILSLSRWCDSKMLFNMKA